MPTAQPTPFDIHRLAVTFVEAATSEDAEQILAVLATVTESELGVFLEALAGMIEHALRARPDAGMPAFLAAYRRVLDQAEHLAGGTDRPGQN